MRRLITLALAIAALPVVFLAMLIVHESGHTLVAWALGDRGATFALVGPGCFGCNYYNSAGMGPLANTAVNLGGSFFTGILTWAAIAALAWRGRPRLIPGWLCLELVAICFIDLGVQVLQAALRPIPDAEPVATHIGYVDFEAAVSFFSQASGWTHGAVAAIGLVLVAAYAAAVVVGLRVATTSRRGT